MSSTYTPFLGLEQPPVGYQNNVWGSSLNNDFALIDQGVSGVNTVTLTTTSYTMTITDGANSNGRNPVTIFSGTPGGVVAVVIAPSNIQKVFWLVNNSNQALSISNGGGSSASLVANSSGPFVCNGSGSVFSLFSPSVSIPNVNISGALTVNGSLDCTGPATVNGLFTATGLVSMADPGSDITVNPGTGSETLKNYITSLYASGSLPGNAVVSTVSSVGVSGGNYTVFVFGSEVGTRFVIGLGQGTTGVGSSGFAFVPTCPSGYGFPTSPNLVCASVNYAAVSSGGGNITSFSSATTGGSIITTATQSGSGTATCGSSWSSVCFATGY